MAFIPFAISALEKDGTRNCGVITLMAKLQAFYCLRAMEKLKWNCYRSISTAGGLELETAPKVKIPWFEGWKAEIPVAQGDGC